MTLSGLCEPTDAVTVNDRGPSAFCVTLFGDFAPTPKIAMLKKFAILLVTSSEVVTLTESLAPRHPGLAYET